MDVHHRTFIIHVPIVPSPWNLELAEVTGRETHSTPARMVKRRSARADRCAVATAAHHTVDSGGAVDGLQQQQPEHERRMAALRVKAGGSGGSEGIDLEQRVADFVGARAVCGKRGRLSSKGSERRVLLIGITKAFLLIGSPAIHWD